MPYILPQIRLGTYLPAQTSRRLILIMGELDLSQDTECFRPALLQTTCYAYTTNTLEIISSYHNPFSLAVTATNVMYYSVTSGYICSDILIALNIPFVS